MIQPVMLLNLAFFSILANACAPIPIPQQASLVPAGEDRMGLSGALVLPLEANTRWTPDGELTPTASARQPDLQYTPLPSATGWIRRGTGWGETQVAVSMPSFLITVATKVGLVGLSPESSFSLALSAEANAAPITASLSVGSTLLSSVSLGRGITMDMGVRVGNFTGIWQGLTVTPTVGMTLPLQGDKQFHIGIGCTLPTATGDSTYAAWLQAGATFR